VDIYTRCHDPEEPQVVHLAGNVRVVHLQAAHWDRPKESLYSLLPGFQEEMAEYVRRNGLEYDVVHAHYWLSGLVALEWRQTSGIPVIATMHSLGEVQRRVRLAQDARERVASERRIVAEADQMVAGSPDEREQLLRLYGAPLEKTNVVPCGYNADLFRPMDRAASRRQLGLTGSRIILFVGRMDRIKGVDIVLRASAALEERDGLQIVMIGGAPNDREVARLRALARELGIEHNLLFPGAVPQQTLPRWYSAADVCIVPSYYETFGLVAVEAMACGTPVIAARVGGLQATIMDGRTGYLVPWHCPEPYAERLETILGNEGLRAAFGQAARESVAHLTWDRAVDNLLDVYSRALGRPRISLKTLAPCA
jgi:D-inositol-3-phosphate glycosyltransferase